MEVYGHTYWTLAMIHFMAAAAVGKTATLTGLARQVQSIESMANSGELKITKEREASFLKALDDNQGIIIKICRAYSDTQADEEDLFQEIVYQLWKAWQSFEGSAKVSTWMHTIAVRTAIMPFRRGGEKVEIELHEVLPDRAAADDPVPTGVGDRLFKFFHHLSNFDRAILALVMEGYTHREIASILKLREGAVKKRMSRMKTMLDEY